MREAITYTSSPSRYENFLTKKTKASISPDRDTMWLNSTRNQIEGTARSHPDSGTLSIFAMLNLTTEFTADISLGELNNSLHPVVRLESEKVCQFKLSTNEDIHAKTD
jgi:hypothetical protein